MHLFQDAFVYQMCWSEKLDYKNFTFLCFFRWNGIALVHFSDLCNVQFRENSASNGTSANTSFPPNTRDFYCVSSVGTESSWTIMHDGPVIIRIAQ